MSLRGVIMNVPHTPTLFCLAALTALVGCGSDDDTTPEPRPPVPIRAGAISLVLDGAFAPYEPERRQSILEHVDEVEVDVLCLNQVMRESDKQAVAQAAQAAFPHSAWVRTDASSVPDDPRDLQGVTPQPPTTPPCSVAETVEKIDAAADCLAANCSTIPDSKDGLLKKGSCMVQKCAASSIPLLAGDAEHKRCFSCLLYTVMSETIADTQRLCKEDPAAGFAFLGENGTMILSRYPISDTSLWVLPSTAWRGVLLSVTVQPPSGPSLRVHCTTTTGAKSASTQPYAGLYGGGEQGDQAWENESLLQATQTVGRVTQTPGPAVVLGDLYSGKEWAEATPPLAPFAPDGFAVFDNALTEAVSPDYPPTCTYCEDNPLWEGSSSINAWTAHVFLHGLALEDVTATRRLATDNVLTITTEKDGVESTFDAPLTPRYGIMSEVLVPR